MLMETNFLLSNVTQRETSVAGGDDFDTLIRFRLFKVTRNCSCIEAPEPIVDDEANFVMENQASVLTSKLKQLKHRHHYRQVMSQVLSSMGVTGPEDEVIVNKLFEVVKVAEAGLPIIVGLGDVTVRFWDSTCSTSNLSLEDVKVQRCIEDLQDIIDWLTLRDPMNEDTYESIIPATKASIDGLEKVRLESLDSLEEEASVGQRPTCYICLEGFDQGNGGDITGLPCTHLYHRDCISQWLNRNRLCPVCRYPTEEGKKPSKGLLHWPSMLIVLSAVTVGVLSALLRYKLKFKQDHHSEARRVEH